MFPTSNLKLSVPSIEQLVAFSDLKLNEGNLTPLTQFALISGVRYQFQHGHKRGFLYTHYEGEGKLKTFDDTGRVKNIDCSKENVVRPLLQNVDFAWVEANKRKNNEGLWEVILGRYPQFVASIAIQDELTKAIYVDPYELSSPTGVTYSLGHRKVALYHYKGKDYTPIYTNDPGTVLSNSRTYASEDLTWFKVSPVAWLVDEKNHLLISKYGLVSFSSSVQVKDYELNCLNSFLEMTLNKELFQNIVETNNYLTSSKEECTLQDDFIFVQERLNLLRASHPESLELITSIQERVTGMEEKVQKDYMPKIKVIK